MERENEHPAAPGRRAGAWIKKNAVLVIALCAAAISALFVPPDGEYAGYFDVKTLCCLFGTLAVVCALKNIHFFAILARRLIRLTGNTRAAALALAYITFIGSMLIANDMALITFLPLGYFVFSTLGDKRQVAFVFILQNIAANLGGMLTPFGNPQNLYLYAHYHIPTGEFMGVMLLPFLVAMALVTGCCFLLPRHSLRIDQRREDRLPPVRTAAYLLLFALTILMVFRLLPVWLALGAVIAGLLLLDRRALLQVDYGLLCTFVCFFIFSGNMSRLAPVRDFFSRLLQANTLLTAVLSCQCISNVPSAILLSQFTDNYAALLRGVNIGGTGTLIASLASLITFREYVGHYREETKTYLKLFALLNAVFLGILTGLCLLAG